MKKYIISILLALPIISFTVSPTTDNDVKQAFINVLGKHTDTKTNGVVNWRLNAPITEKTPINITTKNKKIVNFNNVIENTIKKQINKNIEILLPRTDFKKINVFLNEKDEVLILRDINFFKKQDVMLNEYILENKKFINLFKTIQTNNNLEISRFQKIDIELEILNKKINLENINIAKELLKYDRVFRQYGNSEKEME